MPAQNGPERAQICSAKQHLELSVARMGMADWLRVATCMAAQAEDVTEFTTYICSSVQLNQCHMGGRATCGKNTHHAKSVETTLQSEKHDRVSTRIISSILILCRPGLLRFSAITNTTRKKNESSDSSRRVIARALIGRVGGAPLWRSASLSRNKLGPPKPPQQLFSCVHHHYSLLPSNHHIELSSI
nr:hypothetical protein CFP56_60200 [Quercus suber]